MSARRFLECAINEDLLGCVIAAQGIEDKNEEHECLGNTTLVHYAVSQYMPELVTVLVEMGASTNVKDRFNTSPLEIATRKNRTDLVMALLDGGANVNLRGGDREATSLFYSVFWRASEVTTLLLAAGADTNLPDKELRTPLHAASAYSDEKVVLSLIKCGAEVGNKTAEGITPLHVATSNVIAKILIEAGAFVDTPDMYGVTPLLSLVATFTSVRSGVLETIKVLLEAGADINHKDNSGRSPLSVAIRINNAEILSLFTQVKKIS